ncbi:MAG: M23 family metallopeptidase [Oleiphilaceae bacterium]|nr:M23 family metallopeptidase [Oleiphilaceae bacterium]
MHRLIMISLMGLMLAGSAQALELKGEYTQGALLTGKVGPGSRVTLNGDPVRVTEQGEFAIGFGRNADPEHTLAVEGPDGEKQQKTLEIRQREYDIQRIEGVPQETVTPDESFYKRIREEAAQVRRARSQESDQRAFLGDYIWPVEGRISGVYGSQRYYNGEPRQPHYGVDVAVPEGTPVKAPADGIVRLAEPDLYFSGGTLLIDHGFGVSSTMLHLSKLLVEEGQPVRQGEVIAEVGMTGRATGPHLDWRMNWHNVRIDPVTLAPPLKDGYTPGAERP